MVSSKIKVMLDGVAGKILYTALHKKMKRTADMLSAPSGKLKDWLNTSVSTYPLETTSTVDMSNKRPESQFTFLHILIIDS